MVTNKTNERIHRGGGKRQPQHEDRQPIPHVRITDRDLRRVGVVRERPAAVHEYEPCGDEDGDRGVPAKKLFVFLAKSFRQRRISLWLKIINNYNLCQK